VKGDQVSWQDELRRLDEELATGRISADDYRTRRDQVMSAAVSPGSEPKPTPPAESTTIMQPVPPSQPEGGADADKTQIVSGKDMEQPDRTQVVGGGWQTTRPGGPEEGERTQYVPGVPSQNIAGNRPAPQNFPPGPGGFPPPNEPPWQQQEDLSPPWGGQEFLPLAAANNPDWSRQGPEVFDEGKSSGPWKVLGIIGIVVVLLGIAAGAYFMFRPDSNQASDDNGDNPGNNSSETNQSEEPEPEPEGPIVELPGKVSDMSAIDTFEKVKGIDYLHPQEIAIYETAGAAKATVAIAEENGVRIIILVTEQTDAPGTIVARDALGQLQLAFTLTEREAPAGVIAAANEQASKGPLLRAHYASGTSLVRLQAQGEDSAETNRLFDDILEAQLERLPADG
jgi:hypothetical protein